MYYARKLKNKDTHTRKTIPLRASLIGAHLLQLRWYRTNRSVFSSNIRRISNAAREMPAG